MEPSGPLSARLEYGGWEGGEEVRCRHEERVKPTNAPHLVPSTARAVVWETTFRFEHRAYTIVM